MINDKIKRDSLEAKLEELEDEDLNTSILEMLQYLYDNLHIWVKDPERLHNELNRTIQSIRNI